MVKKQTTRQAHRPTGRWVEMQTARAPHTPCCTNYPATDGRTLKTSLLNIINDADNTRNTSAAQPDHEQNKSGKIFRPLLRRSAVGRPRTKRSPRARRAVAAVAIV